MGTIDRTIYKLAMRWAIPPGLLLDVYDLMINSPRFYSTRPREGIKYQQMTIHLRRTYKIEVTADQLKYLVERIRHVR